MAEYINYKRNLTATRDLNFFLLPWAYVVLKNCDEEGELLAFKNKKIYKEQKKSFWLMLKLHLFRDNLSNFYLYFYRLIVFFLLFKVGVFSLFSFPECESMQDFSLAQPREDMSALM